MNTCKECVYWCPSENNPEKGTCKNPERHDVDFVYYYGYVKANDYCTKFSRSKEELE